MKIPETILTALSDAVAAGQYQTLRFEAGKTPHKTQKRSKRRLRASESWRIYHANIIHSSGISLPACSFWSETVAFRLSGREYRFRLLNLDQAGKLEIFAIPVSEVEHLKCLPGRDFTQSEVGGFLLMANDISEQSQKETVIQISHSLQECIQEKRSEWLEKPNETQMLELLQSHPTIIPITVAALDCQLRCYKKFQNVPLGLYNFTTPSGDLQADNFLISVLTATNFTNKGEFSSAQPIEWIVKDIGDLESWFHCHERLVLIRTATGSLLNPLLKQIDERERLRICGGQLPPPLPTFPIAQCKSILYRKNVVDTALPKGLKTLSVSEQDLLRTMVASCLSKGWAQVAYDNWKRIISSRDNYRLDGFSVWQYVLGQIFIGVNFQDRVQLEQALHLLDNERERQRIEQQQKELILQKAIELLINPIRYEKEIIERPASKGEAIQKLEKDQEAVAFRYTPSKGNDAGKSFLAFSKNSLCRLLKRVSCDESLWEAFLNQCEKTRILAGRNRSINLGGDTFTAITFWYKK